MRFANLSPVMGALFLSGCVMTPTEPNFSITVAAKRGALADCMYLALGEDGIAWTKTELASLGTTRLSLGNSEVQQGHVDFADAGSGTVVTSYLQQGLRPAGYWTRYLTPKLKACGG